MATYELDDDLVREWLKGSSARTERLAPLAEQMRAQLPIPVPVKIGAVVLTEVGAFVRVDGSTTPWVRAIPKAPYFDKMDWLADDQIGRIAEVLSPGVDL